MSDKNNKLLLPAAFFLPFFLLLGLYALLGIARPGDLGFDVMHFNLSRKLRAVSFPEIYPAYRARRSVRCDTGGSRFWIAFVLVQCYAFPAALPHEIRRRLSPVQLFLQILLKIRYFLFYQMVKSRKELIGIAVLLRNVPAFQHDVSRRWLLFESDCLCPTV